MRIDFESIEFKNFMSFGNKPTIINFKSGLNLVSGANGTGKSTMLLDALAFVLYGRPYRKIKKEELINRTNGKNSVVSCVFHKDHNKFKIIRELKPNNLEIWKNDVKLDLLSSLDLNQAEIDKIIGVDYSMFKQIVSTAVNYNKPFLGLYAHEKRALVEALFSLTILSDMNKLLKVDKTDNKLKLASIETNLKSLNQIIQGIQTQINETNNIIEQLNQEKINTINQIDGELNLLNEALLRENKLLEELNMKMNGVSIEEIKHHSVIFKNQLNDVYSQVGAIQGKIMQSMNNMEKLKVADVCLFCNTKITDQHRAEEVERIRSELITDGQLFESLQSQKDTLHQQESLISAALSEFDKINNDKIQINKNIDFYNHTTSTLVERKTRKLNEDIKIDSESLQNMLEAKKTDFTIAAENYNEESTMAKVYDIVDKMLSDGGVRSDFYSNVVPVLNHKTNEYLQSFELPYIIHFDKSLEYKIKSVTQNQDDLNYNSFSEGEKKRIDISLMLAFIYLSKMLSNWECNLLVFDEILDGAVDENGLSIIIQSIREIIIKNSNIAAYVISHRLTDTSFDSKILVIKNNGFSEVKEI